LQAGIGLNRITSTRLWNITKRFFVITADAIEAESPKMVARNASRWLQMLVKHGFVPAPT
jgi:hypothetical protein